jgi:feruloyl esterase
VSPTDRPPPVSQGYAVFGSDSGHQGSTTNAPAIGLDGTFAMNDEALANYAGDALKKTRDAAMQLIIRRYERTPARSYFAGGSNGGREAFAVITRWPKDFDGAIAAYPYWNAVVHAMTYGRIGRAFAAPGAYSNEAKLSLLFNTVMEACDGLDGAKDGIISDPAACKFDIASLRCAGGGDAGDSCLSDAQIAAIRSLDAPVIYNFPLGGGDTAYPGWPVLAGARRRRLARLAIHEQHPSGFPGYVDAAARSRVLGTASTLRHRAGPSTELPPIRPRGSRRVAAAPRRR